MTNFNLAQAFTVLNKKMGKVLPQPLPNQDTFKLSQIQYEILYLVAMGKSLSEIKNILFKLKNKIYSRGIIQFIIHNHLYRKFEVHSDNELIEKAVVMGIVNIIPPIFFT